jgi:hypothetical protein
MGGLLNAGVIEQAAKSTLGVLSLMCLIVGVIALRLFPPAKTSTMARVFVFVLILASVVGFGRAVIMAHDASTLVTVTVPKVLPDRASGRCDSYSGWYELCSDNQPPDWRVVADSFQLTGNRSCGTGFAECKKTTDTTAKVCWQFRLQGHSEECGHSGNTGIQYSTGNLSVTWQHH